MNRKKFATVLNAQGKTALSQKVFRENPRRDNLINLVLPDHSEEYVKKRSIVKIVPEFYFLSHQIGNIKIKSGDEWTLKYYPLNYYLSTNLLVLCYSFYKKGYSDFKSDGILRSEITEIDDDLRHRTVSRWSIVDLDMELAADPDLELVLVVGKNVYQGRYDRCFNL